MDRLHECSSARLLERLHRKVGLLPNDAQGIARERELIHQSQQGSTEAMCLLVGHHYGQLFKKAKNCNWSIPPDDRIQATCKGFLNGALDYDLARYRVRLLTYARWHIIQELADLDNAESTIRLPENIAAQARFMHRRGEVGSGKMELAVAALNVGDLGDWDHPDEDINIERMAEYALARRAMSELLTPREQEIVERVLLRDEKLVTLGRELGLTSERVRQIKERSLNKLRKKLKSGQE